MQRNILYFSFILLAFVGCKEKNYLFNKKNCINVNLQQKEKKINAEVIKILSFDLDSSTLIEEDTYVQYYRLNNQLIVLNKLKRSLKFFPLDSNRSLQKEIAIPKTLSHVQGFCYVSDDSIFYYSYSNHRLYLCNTVTIIDSITLRPENFLRDPANTASMPFIANFSPLIYHEGVIKATGFFNGEDKRILYEGRTIQTCLNLKTKSLSHRVLYSDVYKEYNWGPADFRNVYSDYNYEKSLHIISFPADHRILTVDNQGRELNYPAHSVSITCNTPLNVDRSNIIMKNNIEMGKFFSLNLSYRNIIYDRYRKVYLRFAELPLLKEDLNKYGLGLKSMKVIVLDSSFNYLGEFDFKRGWSFNNYFVSKAGICFYDALNKNENKAVYEVVKVSL